MKKSILITLILVAVACCAALFSLRTVGRPKSPPLEPGQTTAVLTTAEGQTFPAKSANFTLKKHYDRSDVIYIAKVLYNECRGVPSKTERACVAWVILNRVDAWSKTVAEVVRAESQFAYTKDTPVDGDCIALAQDVLLRWEAENNGFSNTGRVLPPDYLYFTGDGEHNHFRNKFSGDYKLWDYSLDSPYDD